MVATPNFFLKPVSFFVHHSIAITVMTGSKLGG